MRTPQSSEQGAITIHVAIALIAMLAFAGMVIDNGVMYTARAQAQTAADAGALAAATRLMEDSNGTLAAKEAVVYAQRNAVWGLSLDAADIIVPPLPFACPDTIKSCARVDVFRGEPDRTGTAHTNTISTFMMGLVGIRSQGVRATATAQVAAGNAVSCIKPWIVADRWVDNSGTGDNKTGFDLMDVFDPGVDTYSASSGFSAKTDIGFELALKGDAKDYSAGWSREIDLDGGNGGNVYRDEIESCPSHVPDVGLYVQGTPCSVTADTNPVAGCLNVKQGVKQGPTDQGSATLVALDPGAHWDPSTNTVKGGCTDAGTCQAINPTGANVSPRIVPVALFDPADVATNGCLPGNNCMLKVQNLLGFFVEGMCVPDVYTAKTAPDWCGDGTAGNDPTKQVVGRLVAFPGQSRTASGSAGPNTFLKVVRLIR